MIRLLALDIDGTLLDSDGRIPEANREAIARAIDAGVEVALATGRRYDFARPIFEALPGPLTLILSNGAIVKTRDGQTLMRSLLPREIARDVLAPGSRAPRQRRRRVRSPPRGAGRVRSDRLGASAPSPFLRREPAVPERGRAARGVPDGGSDPGDVLRRLRRDARRFRAVCRPRPPSCSVALTEYEHRDFSHRRRRSRRLLERGRRCAPGPSAAGSRRAEVMAMGDNLNDLQMLEFAGTPVLMGERAGGAEDARLAGHRQ